MIPCLRFALKQDGRKTELDGSADEIRPASAGNGSRKGHGSLSQCFLYGFSHCSKTKCV